MPRKSNKKKNNSPKNLHSGEHLKTIKLTIEIQPEVVTLQLKGKPYMDGRRVVRFRAGIGNNDHPLKTDRHSLALGDMSLYQYDDYENLDDATAIDVMTRARTYIVNHLEAAMRYAAQQLLKEAAVQQWLSPDEIDKGLGTSLDRAAYDQNSKELSRRFDEITKELSPLELSKNEMERERQKRMRESRRYEWFQEWVYVYTVQVTSRLQAGARWIIKGKWWAIEAKIINFPFYLLSERWNEAKNIRDNASVKLGIDGIKKKIQAECGPLPDDLLDALFEMKKGTHTYRYQALKIACVDAARQLNYKDATMRQSETIYKILSKYPLYKRPVSPVSEPL